MSVARRGVAVALVVVGIGSSLRGTAGVAHGDGAADVARVTEVGEVGEAAQESAALFFDRYAESDGRVVRHDQGGDTVSEGQAYAMLLAAALDQRERFERVWGWTQANLQRDDGLLSWHWRDGRVADSMPAADADLDAAWALAVAAERFDRPEYRAEAARIATAILDNETVLTSVGPVLVAGPWARVEPFIVNPSYFSPGAYRALRAVTGDPRWDGVARSSRVLLDTLTDGRRLPPDWAQVAPDGTVTPSSPPATDAEPEYAFDAARVPVRAAGACGPDRAPARRVNAALERSDEPTEGRRLDLDGNVVDDTVSAPLLVGSAAAAAAAGDVERGDELFTRAVDVDRDHPTYYGAAWIALGQLIVDGDLALRCSR